MAGHLIVFKNAVQQVKGDVVVADYKDWLRVTSVSWATTAVTNADSGSGSVYQGSVQLAVPFGPWIAELQQKLYHGTMLGDVDLIEIEEKVDAANNKAWKKIREITLIDGWLESMQHVWNGIDAFNVMTVQYTDMTFAIADKIAHFSRIENAGK